MVPVENKCFQPWQQGDIKDCIPLVYTVCGDCKEEREEILLVDASRFKGAGRKDGRGICFYKMVL